MRFDCPVCDGAGCASCHEEGPDRGRFLLVSCPKEFVTSEVWEALFFAELLTEAHLAPAPGGALNQAECFMDAVRFIASERAYWRSLESVQPKG